jgi:hypothetical protein
VIASITIFAVLAARETAPIVAAVLTVKRWLDAYGRNRASSLVADRGIVLPADAASIRAKICGAFFALPIGDVKGQCATSIKISLNHDLPAVSRNCSIMDEVHASF